MARLQKARGGEPERMRMHIISKKVSSFEIYRVISYTCSDGKKQGLFWKSTNLKIEELAAAEKPQKAVGKTTNKK